MKITQLHLLFLCFLLPVPIHSSNPLPGDINNNNVITFKPCDATHEEDYVCIPFIQNYSDTLKEVLNDVSSFSFVEPIPLESISKKTLKKIKKWVALTSQNEKKEAYNFINNLPYKDFFNVMFASDFLCIHELLDSCTTIFAEKSMSKSEMHKLIPYYQKLSDFGNLMSMCTKKHPLFAQVYDLLLSIIHIFPKTKNIHVVEATCTNFSPDGKFLAIGNLNDVKILDPQNHYKRIHTFSDLNNTTLNLPTYSNPFCWHPDGNFLVVCFKQHINIYDCHNNFTLINQITISSLAENDFLCSVYFSLDYRKLISISMEGVITAWDVYNDFTLIDSDMGGSTTGCFDPQNHDLIVSNKAGDHYYMYNKSCNLNAPTIQIKTENGEIVPLMCFSPNSQYFISLTKDYHINILNPYNNFKLIQTITNSSKEAVKSLCFSPDGRFFVVVAETHIKIFNVDNQFSFIRELSSKKQKPFYSVCFSPDGNFLIATQKKKIKIWDLENFHGLKKSYNSITIAQLQLLNKIVKEIIEHKFTYFIDESGKNIFKTLPKKIKKVIDGHILRN